MLFAPIIIAVLCYVGATMSHFYTENFNRRYIPAVGRMLDSRYGVGILAYEYDGDSFAVEVLLRQYDVSDPSHVNFLIDTSDPNTPYPTTAPLLVDKAAILAFLGTCLVCLQVIIVAVNLRPIDTSIDDDLLAYTAIAAGIKNVGGARTPVEYEMIDTITAFVKETMARSEITVKQGAMLSELNASLSRLKSFA